MIKEITVFTYGDSKKISTWSNVPYFLTTTMEKKGIKVNRVDIEPNKYVGKIFNITVKKILDFIYKDNSYNYMRSFLFKIEASIKIKNSVKQYSDSDAFFFLNFDFSVSALTNKMSILFGDWTYEKYVKYFLNKEANQFEQGFIEHQNKVIKESSIVFPLFPGTAEDLSKEFPGKVFYLGNVINSIFEPDLDVILDWKLNSRKILFIGSKKYIDGANVLLKSFLSLKEKYPDMSLHFVGLTKRDFGELPENVYCYGYLDKADESQAKTYYKLLSESRCFVNPSPKWSSFSASVEAMYFYTPVIVPPYDEFVNTFGKNMEAGIFCNDNSKLSDVIEEMLNCDNYKEMCIEAHNLTKDFTWDIYIDKMLAEINAVHDGRVN